MGLPSPFPNQGCLITGCALVDEDERRTVWGDLHTYGQTYVFNAVLQGRGETAWQYDAMPHDGMRQLIITPGSLYFERRGVIVVPLDSARLNPAAFTYVFKKEKT